MCKAQKRLSTDKSPITTDAVREETSSEISESDVTPYKDKGTISSNNEEKPSTKYAVQISSELYSNSEKDNPRFPSLDPLDTDVVKYDADQEEVSATVGSSEASLSTSNGKLLNESSSNILVEHPSSLLASKDIEVDSEDHLEYDIKTETPANQKKPREKNADTHPMVVQDQLAEAQGLLKTNNSTGLCWTSRLQEYKSENAQLEELLTAERELSKSYEDSIKQLQKDLSLAKSEVTKVEENMVEALASKNFEIEALISSMDALKKQAVLSEGYLASLQASMEFIMRNRELTETRMLQALREELTSAERREEELTAHNATKKAAMEREVELEHRAVEASTALARIQMGRRWRWARGVDVPPVTVSGRIICCTGELCNTPREDIEIASREESHKLYSFRKSLNQWRGKTFEIIVGRRSPCLPGDLLGRHVFPTSYKRLHVSCTSQYAGHPRPSDRGHPRPSERAMRGHPRATERVPCTSQHAGHPRPSDRGHPRASEAIREHPTELCEGIRGQPSELCEGIRGKPSECRSPGVHGDLQGHQESMATYVLGRACAMQHVHSLCFSKGRSPGVHGDLECMATYGQHCGFHPI
ncbi:Golgin candidate 1 [Hibiscus syriacus]|uniref:Golgin candidate 1 n=1 Tax=Hibiscus syriacus TaxID=106335 RepID=A0A6A2YU37_HIBSY|nr:Golgin candidate 1 [Hibiscus syriacus]